MLAVSLWFACADPDPPPPLTQTVLRFDTGRLDTGAADTAHTGAAPDPLTAELVSIGYCEEAVLMGYYGYEPTSLEATTAPGEVTVAARSFFSGCGCDTSYTDAVGARLDDDTVTIDLDHGYCDGMFCCAYTVTVRGVPAGAYTVKIPEIDRGKKRVDVVVP